MALPLAVPDFAWSLSLGETLYLNELNGDAFPEVPASDTAGFGSLSFLPNTAVTFSAAGPTVQVSATSVGSTTSGSNVTGNFLTSTAGGDLSDPTFVEALVLAPFVSFQGNGAGQILMAIASANGHQVVVDLSQQRIEGGLIGSTLGVTEVVGPAGPFNRTTVSIPDQTSAFVMQLFFDPDGSTAAAAILDPVTRAIRGEVAASLAGPGSGTLADPRRIALSGRIFNANVFGGVFVDLGAGDTVNAQFDRLSVHAVPEPARALLLPLVLGVLALRRIRTR